MLSEFERVSSRLYLSRLRLAPTDPKRRRIEENMAEASHHMLTLCAEAKKEKESFTTKYRRVWRENFSLFLSTTLIFIASVLIGWYVTYQDPQAAQAFVGQGTMERVLMKQRWFDQIQANAFFDGFLIAKNNIEVSILTFLGGAIFGLGGVYVLVTNGLMLGGLMAFCYRYDFHEEMGTFIISHGFLELSIIVVAAFSGFLFGRVFFMRPYRLFRFRMQKAASEAGVVLMGSLPWLVLAACLEVFVSPWPTFSVTQRIGLGLLAAAAYWGWTFWPIPEGEEKATVGKDSGPVAAQGKL
jgi:uncharacterized membrane protein SpoIIM required for sporulation